MLGTLDMVLLLVAAPFHQGCVDLETVPLFSALINFFDLMLINNQLLDESQA